MARAILTLVIFQLLIFVFAPVHAVAETQLPLEKIKLPRGFTISLFSTQVPGARSLAIAPSGTVYVGSRDEGRVYALIDQDNNGVAERVVTVASGLMIPNGVAFHDGTLYVAELSRIIKYVGIDAAVRGGGNLPQAAVVRDGFPTDRAHGWKFIAVSPDGWIYVPVGAPCNVCLNENPIYAAIHRISLDGRRLETVAHGVRNSVGFAFQPGTGDLWFTDNGRDVLGDDVPADELNHVTRAGQHFGFPFCHQGDLKDPVFGKSRACSEFVKPARKLGPHVAALGMRFYDGKLFPERYRGRIVLAEHGSWNRSKPIGYRVMIVDQLVQGEPTYESLAEGWLQGSSAWGRPVDVAVRADGSLLVSDDKNGVVYRIGYAASSSPVAVGGEN